MTNERLIGCWAALISATPGALETVASAELSMPAIYADQMVLQQNDTVPIHGTADAGTEVAVRASWMDFIQRVNAAEDGSWRVDLQTPADAGPHSISITNGDERVVLNDVLCGEVWIAGGQSNMEWPVRALDFAGIRDTTNAWRDRDASRPPIRFFSIPNQFSATPSPNARGTWFEVNGDNVQNMSAVALFFAERLQEELDVPVAILWADWGGTVAEAWMSRAAIDAHGGFEPQLAIVDEVAEDQKAAAAMDAAERRAERDRVELADPGIRDAWMNADAEAVESADGWTDVEIPGNFTGTLGEFDGYIWVRRTFGVRAGRAKASDAWTLNAGPIDDRDRVWINGTLVGATERDNAWSMPRKYAVPANLLKPTGNVISIRVHDTGGAGGVTGPVPFPNLAHANGTVVGLAGDWKAKASLAESDRPRARPQQPARFHQNLPTVLANGMLESLTPYGARGVIWYQGESNRRRGEQYRTLFPALIKDWRTRFERDLPFGFVQLAPFRDRDGAFDVAALRDAQLHTFRTVDNTGMVVTTDCGDPVDIHPRDKKTVGFRLGNWALGTVYPEIAYRVDETPADWCGPIYASHVVEDASIRIEFDFADALGSSDGRPITHFMIAGDDRVFHPARVTIDGNDALVRSDAVANPVAVRFAFGKAPEPNLIDESGLPASPFRTDDWPLD